MSGRGAPGHRAEIDRRKALGLGLGLGLGVGVGLGIGAAALALGPGRARADEADAAPRPGALVIGSGDPDGVYYAIGQAICRFVSRDREAAPNASNASAPASNAAPLTCEAPATSGSIENLEGLRGGQFQFALVQSDWQREAWAGLGRFNQRGFGRLRSVLSLHREVFTLIARDATRATRLEDLRGMRVDVGAAGSGRRATLAAAMAARGRSLADFAEISQLDARARAAALARGTLDAVVDMVGHPNAGTRAAMAATEARLLPARGWWAEQLIAGPSGYARAEIPGKIYRGAPDPVPSFGLRATLVTTADMDPAVVRRLTRAIFANFDRFNRLHPALAGLDAAEMIRDGLHAPLHPGAETYYRERGWL
ncbi:MAG: C4-dicarboxylate ABC transporter substrate-binding protein [Rhodobacteraceae bacterium]|nr:C4-dicarboxylate ABC transporter substrate-binding protein [Paracoccaceae bacterium]